jgi:hypothetical protein
MYGATKVFHLIQLVQRQGEAIRSNGTINHLAPHSENRERMVFAMAPGSGQLNHIAALIRKQRELKVMTAVLMKWVESDHPFPLAGAVRSSSSTEYCS